MVILGLIYILIVIYRIYEHISKPLMHLLRFPLWPPEWGQPEHWSPDSSRQSCSSGRMPAVPASAPPGPAPPPGHSRNCSLSCAGPERQEQRKQSVTYLYTQAHWTLLTRTQVPHCSHSSSATHTQTHILLHYPLTDALQWANILFHHLT